MLASGDIAAAPEELAAAGKPAGPSYEHFIVFDFDQVDQPYPVGETNPKFSTLAEGGSGITPWQILMAGDALLREPNLVARHWDYVEGRGRWVIVGFEKAGSLRPVIHVCGLSREQIRSAGYALRINAERMLWPLNIQVQVPVPEPERASRLALPSSGLRRR